MFHSITKHKLLILSSIRLSFPDLLNLRVAIKKEKINVESESFTGTASGSCSEYATSLMTNTPVLSLRPTTCYHNMAPSRSAENNESQSRNNGRRKFKPKKSLESDALSLPGVQKIKSSLRQARRLLAKVRILVDTLFSQYTNNILL